MGFNIWHNNNISLLYASLGLFFHLPFKQGSRTFPLLSVAVYISRRIVIQKVENMDILGGSFPAFLLLYESTHVAVC